MQLAVYGRQLKEKDIPFVQELFDVLSERNLNTYVFKAYPSLQMSLSQLENIEGASQ